MKLLYFRLIYYKVSFQFIYNLSMNFNKIYNILILQYYFKNLKLI